MVPLFSEVEALLLLLPFRPLTLTQAYGRSYLAYAPTRNVVDVDVSFFLFSIASFDAALFPNDTFFEPTNGELSLDDCALLALGEPSSGGWGGRWVGGGGVSGVGGEGGGELDD